MKEDNQNKNRKQKKRPQQNALIMILLSILLIIAYFYNNPALPPKLGFPKHLNIGAAIWKNFLILFAYANYVLYLLIGKAVYLFPIFIFMLARGRYHKKHYRHHERIIAFWIWILINISLIFSLFDLLSGAETAMNGGWIGHQGISFFYGISSKFLTTILMITITLLTLHKMGIGNFFSFSKFDASHLEKMENIFMRFVDRLLYNIENYFKGMTSFWKETTKPAQQLPGERGKNTPTQPEGATEIEIPEPEFIPSSKAKNIFDQCEKNIRIDYDIAPPPSTILESATEIHDIDEKSTRQQIARTIEQKFAEFNISGKIVDSQKGPKVTRYELKLDPGQKIKQVTQLADDLALAIGSKSVRFEIPVPGTNSIGIELPNRKPRTVQFNHLIRKSDFLTNQKPLDILLGMDIVGRIVMANIAEMPHLLIAGATGSGKSVFLNSVLCGLLFKNKTSSLRLILIDVKRTELTPYQHLPHLLCPVLTEVAEATEALYWAIHEMDERYKKLEKTKTRHINEYNERISSQSEKLPFILIIIDELADLMMQSDKRLEDSIVRLAQKARAVGINLVVATQRPSVDIITGLIKANFPARAAFRVSSMVDSRVILDENGAERLMGKGDMLFKSAEDFHLQRRHAAFISTDEVNQVVQYWQNK